MADNRVSHRAPSRNGRRCFLPPPSGSPGQLETPVRFGDPLLTANHDAAILLAAMAFGPKLSPGTAVLTAGQESNLFREEAPDESDQSHPTGGLDLMIVCDSELVKQAAQHLLANATPFMERGKEVPLSGDLVSNGAIVEISDQRLAVLAQLGITSATLSGGAPHFLRWETT